MPQVTLIIVNYNGRAVVMDCLRALERQSFKDFEILIVDNASSDGSLDEIEEFLRASKLSSLVTLVPLSTNAGFAGGNLEGLKHANGKYIALLNSDTEPEKKWLEELVMNMDNDPGVGICASKLVVHGTDIIDSGGDGFSTSFKGFKRGEGEKTSLYNQSEYVFGACGGAALYKRKMIEEIGFFDEDFFLIHEDTDLNFRAQLQGWKVRYVPTAIVYHKVRSSIGIMSNMAVYYTLRNSELVRMKNVPLSIFIRCFPQFFIGMLTEIIYFIIKRRRLRLYFKGKIDSIGMFPKMLKKRAVIMKNRKVSDTYLLKMMTPVWTKGLMITKIKKFLHA
jgi:GT2 family glycosyltransferase